MPWVPSADFTYWYAPGQSVSGTMVSHISWAVWRARRKKGLV